MRQPMGPFLNHRHSSHSPVGPGRATLGFISRNKFYCCNYIAVNCAKTGSSEDKQPPAGGHVHTFVCWCFSLLPSLGLLRPCAAAVSCDKDKACSAPRP